jgi:hypothetical protein
VAALPPGLAALVVIALPRVCEACAVCFTGKEDDSRVAFIATTGFLTFLPLLMLGGLFWWARGRLRENDRENERLRDAAQQASASR